MSAGSQGKLLAKQAQFCPLHALSTVVVSISFQRQVVAGKVWASKRSPNQIKSPLSCHTSLRVQSQSLAASKYVSNMSIRKTAETDTKNVFVRAVVSDWGRVTVPPPRRPGVSFSVFLCGTLLSSTVFE